MWKRITPWILASTTAWLVAGCCSGPKCLEKYSSLDQDRVHARPVGELGKVINDNVSSPRKDRTDWYSVKCLSLGKLTVELHWDNGKARLELSVYDVMGILIQDGRVWGTGGLKSVVAIEQAGQYYVRVRAAGEDDESQYALRIGFQPDVGKVCHDCKEGDKKCLGEEGYLICEKKGPNCNAWTQTFACPEGAKCKDGSCSKDCNQCEEGSLRCDGPRKVQACKLEEGCLVWGPAAACGANKTCYKGRCAKRGQTPREPEPRPPEPKTCVKGKIISMYTVHGRKTLHIQFEDATGLRPGMQGDVLEGTTQKPLPSGGIKLTKITGNFGIATTDLSQLGMNRWVCIKP